MGRIVAAPILGNALRFVFFLAAGGRSSNGRTPDSGSGYLGSNPSLPANLFFFVANHLTHSRPHLTSLRMAHFAQTLPKLALHIAVQLPRRVFQIAFRSQCCSD